MSKTRYLSELPNGIQSVDVLYDRDLTGTFERNVSERNLDYSLNLFDFIPVSAHQEIRDARAGSLVQVSYDCTADLQAAIEAANDIGGAVIYIPAGRYKITSTVYFNYSNIQIVGAGIELTEIYYENASGGTGFASFSSYKTGLTDTTNSCEFRDLSLTRSRGDYTTAAGLDPDIWIDYSHFSYSKFNKLSIQTCRPNAICFYGQGNTGTSPYYNLFDDLQLYGGAAAVTGWNQIGIKLSPGLWPAGSNGPNANYFYNVRRAAALGKIVELETGVGNFFSKVSGESITDAYFDITGVAAIESGTSSGSNSAYSLIDTSKTWAVNDYTNGAVKITGGTGIGQIRTIWYNNSDSLRIYEPWAILPDATSTYEIYPGKTIGNYFSDVRGEGGIGLGPVDCFRLGPGTASVEAERVDAQSLYGGYLVNDNSGSVRNKIISVDKEFREVVLAPGPGANIDIYPRNGAIGGLLPGGGNYSLRWLTLSADTSSLGDSVSVTLDAGGAAVGGGFAVLTATISDGQTAASDIAFGDTRGKDQRGGDTPIFLNLQTGASFSPTANITITWSICS